MDRPKPFSMIREFHLADWFTLGNACAGMGALFAVMTFLQSGDARHLQYACALRPRGKMRLEKQYTEDELRRRAAQNSYF